MELPVKAESLTDLRRGGKMAPDDLIALQPGETLTAVSAVVALARPATDAAASAWSTSRPVRSTVFDGDGGSAWAALAHVMIDSSWASTASEG